MYNYNYEGSPLMTICLIFISVVAIISWWRLFEKAGEKGWKALVPFYSTYTLFKIIYGNGWRFLLLLIPFANIVFLIMAYIHLGEVFGKSALFKVGLVFLSTVFFFILAFDNSQYLGIHRKK